jgi:hypothetical protein
MIRTAFIVALGLPALAWLARGTEAVLPAAIGSIGSVAVQLLAWRAYLRAMPPKDPPRIQGEEPAAVMDWNERALRALGAAAAIRLFGGVTVVAVVLVARVAEPLAFVASFALGYGALEIAVGRWLIANEHARNPVETVNRGDS